MREREKAERWWAEVGREEAKCDICDGILKRGEGYIVDSAGILGSRFLREKLDLSLRVLGVIVPARPDWLLCRECFLGYKADRDLMVAACRELDEITLQQMARLEREHRILREEARKVADIRDFFMYLTLDALEDRELADRLEGIFTELEGRSRTHKQFFFTLGQILSVRHEISRLPGEKISREEFEKSWKRTREELGI